MIGERARLTLGVIPVSVALLAFTSIYRFTTLGGAFGGFDNDHFVSFAYAKQLQAGERPLQDYDDLGAQGAWPPLAHGASAAGQVLLGDTLRSEALVAIGAVAVAAGVTAAAAALVAPLGWAALCTLFTIFVAPTLYNFSKVLALGVAVLLIAVYARRPGLPRLVSLAAWTAIAFLFRHDFAVYVGAGVVAAIVATARRPERIARELLVYGAITIALLTPSLAYVQRHAGLIEHLRNTSSLSEREAQRTRLSWPAFTWSPEDGPAVRADGVLAIEQNAVAWLYYLFLLLPVVAAAVLWRTRAEPQPPGRTPTMLACATMLVAGNQFLLRGNPAVRFGDIGPLYAVLLAAMLGALMRRWTDERSGPWLARVAVTGVVLIGTLLSVWTVGVIRRQLETSGFSVSPRQVEARAGQVWHELGALPGAYWSGEPATPLVAAAQYLNRCLAPTDRVLIMPYVPELLPLADRRFAGGRASILPGLLTMEGHQQTIVTRWQSQSVPVALVDEADVYDRSYPAAVPIVHAYLRERYELAGHLQVAADRSLRVFAERARRPVGTFQASELPCFR